MPPSIVVDVYDRILFHTVEWQDSVFTPHCLATNILFGKLTASLHEIWPALRNIADIRLCSADITQNCRISTWHCSRNACCFSETVQSDTIKKSHLVLTFILFISLHLHHHDINFSVVLKPGISWARELSSQSSLCSIGLCFQIIHRSPV